jgi:hypothetical protein
VKLSKFLRGASASEAPPRRWPVPRETAPGTSFPGARKGRRAPRAGGPRTIIPIDDDATPSWLHTPVETASSSFELNVDAARERLRRAIPPVADDDQ